MDLTEAEKGWLIALEDFGLTYLARDENDYKSINIVAGELAAYSHPPQKSNDIWCCTDYTQEFLWINKNRFKFIDSKTIFKICRNSSGELELVPLKGEIKK